jgi:hypothetical protein
MGKYSYKEKREEGKRGEFLYDLFIVNCNWGA